MDTWTIDCPDGVGVGTKPGDSGCTVKLNGQVVNARSVTLNIETDDVVTAAIVVENVQVSIGALKEFKPRIVDV